MSGSPLIMVHWRLVAMAAIVTTALSLGLYEWSRVANCEQMSSSFENIQNSYNLRLGDYRIREHDYDDYITRVNRTGVLDSDLTKDLAILRTSLDTEKAKLDAGEQRLSDTLQH